MSTSSYRRCSVADSALRATVNTDRYPENCPICFEAITTALPTSNTHSSSDTISRSGAAENSKVAATIIKCGHVFCRRCIERWARTDNTCPNCRAEMYPWPTQDDAFNVTHEYNVVVSTTVRRSSMHNIRVSVNGGRMSTTGDYNGVEDDVEGEDDREPGGWSHRWVRRYHLGDT
ncbi:hypothetical protein HBI95_039890 [Parastagonospora nodorum]|nr:hypothetical protein HBI95_039890 [Parastagonospora nodorum]KAH5274209.1 hypothetical protein HBI71_041100 [Parastagonospora nodorum]KAH5456144.1 hypothetical protein HBI30_083130 [Parastagonospora nodorum]KAH5738188.1 hypothetical protein HBI20_011100 [Parastagonospora nodorum]KAH5764185.1 hypothetical protein HBI17_044730 [Parastagonospora nodorum]